MLPSTNELLRDFEAMVARLQKHFPTKIEDQLHAAVGISGEAGELLDAIKKSWVYGKPLDMENVKEECGDILHYLQMQLFEAGLTIEDAILHNMTKLRKRYPAGYSDAAAIARADKTETGETVK